MEGLLPTACSRRSRANLDCVLNAVSPSKAGGTLMEVSVLDRGLLTFLVDLDWLLLSELSLCRLILASLDESDSSRPSMPARRSSIRSILRSLQGRGVSRN